MNFSNILSEIERLDPEVYERTSDRRKVIKNWTRRVSLAALPLAIGSLFNKAYGKTNDAITDVLQFALKLEYLEMELYRRALEATDVLPPKQQLIPSKTGLEVPAIKMILKHEQQHVNFLSSVLQGMGMEPINMPKFDFTGAQSGGSGQFAQVFTDYGTFLALAQTFEDTGVRAYKGQVGTVKADNALLTNVMRIHSIEARHAAHIRLMRSQWPSPLADNLVIRPWITLNQTGINGIDVQKAYDGEQNTTQAATEIININGFQIDDKLASQAFDEPLSADDVGKIIAPFIIP
jgi:hypothetical protein